MRILVLAGGESPEHSVSVKSGKAVATGFASSGHLVALVDPTRVPKRTEIAFTGAIETAFSAFDALQKTLPTLPLDPRLAQITKEADVVFPALHGGIGENGLLAAYLEANGIKYCGSDFSSLDNSMDKVKTKILYENTAILTPKYTVYKKGSKRAPIPPSYPCVVKPANGGSSVEVSFAKSEIDLAGAIGNAFSVCDNVILEEKIVGREFSVSVLEDKALAVTEIIPNGRFYDYDSKYLHGGAREITPAPLSVELTKRALSIALRAHRALGLKNFSRTDLILKKGTSLFYALETNSLPGLTETSILPSAANARGIDFKTLISKMLI